MSHDGGRAREEPNIAVIADPGGGIRVEEIAEPSAGASEVVVAVEYGGICGSDLHYWKHGAAGQSVLQAPMVLGHEVVGRIEVPAADGSGPRAGQRVVVHPGTWGQPPYRFPPDRPQLSGGSYLGSAARVPHCDGAFARRIALASSMVRSVPATVQTEDAALAEPAAVALHAVRRAGDLRGRRVLVTGSGPIGLLVAAWARTAGATEVVCTDMHAAPLEIARSLGATATLLASDVAGVAATDADVVFETSGNRFGLDAALQACTRGGIVVLVGLQPAGPQPTEVAVMISRELDVRGSFRFVDEIDEVLGALADGSLVVTGVVTHVVAAARALEAFELASAPERSSKVLLDFQRS